MEKENEYLADIRVGITIGDINGIGAEVIIKALADNRILQGCTPIIYASAKTLSFHKKYMHGEDIQYQTCKDATDAKRRKINIVQTWEDEPNIDLGKANEEGGKYAFRSLEKATQDLTTNKLDVLVTAPISKETIAKAGFQFPGHTEYLADMAGAEALMMMVAGDLRVALVTTHVALKEVSQVLTKDMIHQRLVQVEQSLKKDFGILRPKIAVLGMNPHAGENGKMGDEEANIIVPGINLAKNNGVIAFGPFPADGFFGSHARNQYDAVLAMYHDQGLAPFKALAFDEGVNYTAGLPIVRTSPDHGTAFDIAGKDEASASSFRNALYLAMDVYRMRKTNKENNANPLPISPKEKKRPNSRDIE